MSSAVWTSRVCFAANLQRTAGHNILKWRIKGAAAMRSKRQVPSRLPHGFAIAAFLALGCSAAMLAQEPGKQVVVEEKDLQALITRVEQLEARVKQLESERA